MRARKRKHANYKKITLLLVLILVLISVPSVLAQRQTQPGEEVTYLVQSGDTLWSIARQHRGSTEIRRYIEQIKKTNQLQAQHIYPGQILVLPGQ